MTIKNLISETNCKEFEPKSYFKNDNFLVSIVIPLYNEEKSIQNVLYKIPNHHPTEIIIVDDGSTDNSIEKIKKINDSRIKIIKHKINRGYGNAILTGFKHSKGDIIVTLDSDGQHNPEEISKIIKPIIKNEADVVIGSRYLGECTYKIPLHVRTGEIFIANVLWIFFGKKIKNNQSGYRAFNKKSIKLLKHTKFTGMGFTTEILFRSSFNNLKICEIPITVEPRKHGISRVKLIKLIKSVLLCIAFYMFQKFK